MSLCCIATTLERGSRLWKAVRRSAGWIVIICLPFFFLFFFFFLAALCPVSFKAPNACRPFVHLALWERSKVGLIHGVICRPPRRRWAGLIMGPRPSHLLEGMPCIHKRSIFFFFFLKGNLSNQKSSFHISVCRREARSACLCHWMQNEFQGNKGEGEGEAALLPLYWCATLHIVHSTYRWIL